MKRNRFLKLEIIILLILLINPTIAVTAMAETHQRVLIVCDDNGAVVGKWIKDMMITYGNIGNLILDDEYNQDRIVSYDKVIIISSQGLIDNSLLIEDIKNYDKNILWIGDGVENIFSREQSKILRFTKEDVLIKKISYTNTISTTTWNTNMNNDEITYSLFEKDSLDKILSYFSDGKEEYPNLWIKDNITHLVIVPYDTNTYYLLADSLNDFFGISNIDTSKIFIKLEDIDIFRDINQLKDISDYLYSESVPFVVSLIPVYIDEDSDYVNTLSQMSGFIEILKYMQHRGGSIVLNVSSESRDYIYSNMEIIIEECVSNGIYPLALENRDIFIKNSIEKEVNKHFSTFMGKYHRKTSEKLVINYPYILTSSDSFKAYIPENLGEISPENRAWLDLINEKIKSISMVRGYVGGLSFNSYLDIEYLKETIKLLKYNNINFMDLRSLNNIVKYKDIEIKSFNGKVDLNYNKNIEMQDISNEYREEKIVGMKITSIAFSIVVILIFISVYLYYKKINKKNTN